MRRMTKQCCPTRTGPIRGRRLPGASGAALVTAAAAAALLAPATTGQERSELQTTLLVSRGVDGGPLNAPARNPDISHDLRIGRVVVYESEASNAVPGDSNGVSDVFLVNRARPWGEDGTPWSPGSTELASRGLRGQPANGPSYKPTVDGEARGAPPSCVGFISHASNLVPRDTNGLPDAFVYWLKTGKVERVSVSSRRRQASGASFDIDVDGDCKRVAFTTDARNLGTRGKRQVFVRGLKARESAKAIKGKTIMASVTKKGRPGNGDSAEPDFPDRWDRSLAFSSTGGLAGRDRNGISDVYKVDADIKGRRYRFRSPRLVSANGAGRAGNGPSSHPAYSDQDDFIAYQTDASDLLPGDTNGVTDVARWGTGKRRAKGQMWVSKGAQGIGNGPSRRPETSLDGFYVVFDSEASNFEGPREGTPDMNGVSDVFLYTFVRNRALLESRSAANEQLPTPSWDGATSARGNYVLFLNNGPYAVPHVHMRYLGPK